MSGRTFFMFPLCLLAMPLTEKERLELIISHGIECAGARSDIDDTRIVKKVAEDDIKDYDGSDEHKRLIRGAIVCEVELNCLAGIVKECAQAREFINNHEAQYGTDARVFVSTQLLWHCRNCGDPSFRLFSLLCAVNSVIGIKRSAKPVLIRRPMLIARQLGYKTPRVMTAALCRRQDQTPLTIQQLRTSLDHLELRNLIRRCQASRRNVYFTTRLNSDELRKAVCELKDRKHSIRLNRSLDRKLWRDSSKQPLNNEQQQK